MCWMHFHPHRAFGRQMNNVSRIRCIATFLGALPPTTVKRWNKVKVSVGMWSALVHMYAHVNPIVHAVERMRHKENNFPLIKTLLRSLTRYAHIVHNKSTLLANKKHTHQMHTPIQDLFSKMKSAAGVHMEGDAAPCPNHGSESLSINLKTTSMPPLSNPRPN